ncbi:MAG: ATP-grasp domain-containing protein, partial [Actinobacteria bacterium]|nr:ATP-grasp domain-containing protein [Actinomycetota bacterium]
MSDGAAAGRRSVVSKVLIANRGEIAVRVARTCREMGLATVAVFSDADADALHVDVCDEAVRIGGPAPADSYLRIDAILDAARRTGADAVHPGFGFLSENADFARAVLEAGLVWVGPAPEAIAAMGDKLEAKRRMADAGVPLLPSVDLGDSSPGDDDLAVLAGEVGFPLMVKAAAGGGGKGMRVVRSADDLGEAVAAAQREAVGAFGDGRVFLERYVEAPRHVEIQILGDRHGTVVHVFERECSIQRRHQKVIEESPSPVLTDEVRSAMGAAAVAAGEAIGYESAGTVEFILDASDPSAPTFAFLEVNTRLQVEHPVTELVTGLDLVRLQLLVAMGEPLPFAQTDLEQRGHAIEARLYAEDPANGYLPATGTLHAFEPADVDGVRYDAGVRSGDVVSPHYDPMLAKVVAWAPTRGEAAARLARALERSVVHGVRTNRDLLVAILREDAFLAGDTTTDYLPERYPTDEARGFAPAAGAIEVASAAVTLASVASRPGPGDGAGAGVLATIPPGFANVPLVDQTVAYRVADEEVAVPWRRRRDGSFELGLGDRTVEARLVAVDDRTVTVELDGHRQRVRRSTVGR